MGLIKNLPPNERPREKAFLYGIESLNNAELLAILLCTGSKGLDALELSYKLLKEVGSLKKLDELSLEELSSFNGIKKAKALKIKAALQLFHQIKKEETNDINVISNIKLAAKFLHSQIVDDTIEHLQILLLNSKNQIITTKIMTIGTANCVISSPNEIIKFAISHKANKLIIAHNHPSNNLIPSQQDIEQTENIILLSSLMDLNFIDHLILGNKKFYSFYKKTEFNY